MKYQYVCIFDDLTDGKNFYHHIKSKELSIENLEDEGHTICFVGTQKLLSEIEKYKLPVGVTLQVERRPAGSDPDEAESEGLVEFFAYYGTND